MILKERIQAEYKDIRGDMKERLAFRWMFELRNTTIQLIIPVEEKVKF